MFNLVLLLEVPFLKHTSYCYLQILLELDNIRILLQATVELDKVLLYSIFILQIVIAQYFFD